MKSKKKMKKAKTKSKKTKSNKKAVNKHAGSSFDDYLNQSFLTIGGGGGTSPTLTQAEIDFQYREQMKQAIETHESAKSKKTFADYFFDIFGLKRNKKAPRF